MIKNRLFLCVLFIVATFTSNSAQNTIGVLSASDLVAEGYTLIPASGDKDVYLIDNCGRIVHDWNTECRETLANYIDKAGNLIRSCREEGFATGGGVGGKLERYSWDGEREWFITIADDRYHLHHDFEVLDNGNILILAYERFTVKEWKELGSTTTLMEGDVFSEAILEIQPVESKEYEIVWEWHLSDHLVQDVSADFIGFGDIMENKSKMDINVNTAGTVKDWIHFNSISYNDETNQIILSSKFLNEIYVIEKTETSDVAAADSGGRYEVGGDFLYRWGNESNYDKSSSSGSQIANQHNVQWFGKETNTISIFNNGDEGESSVLEVILPQTNEKNYVNLEEHYEDASIVRTVLNIDEESFYSSVTSGAQRLENGNMIFTISKENRIVEVDKDNKVVWLYIIPINSGTRMNQGDNPEKGSSIFNINKYSSSYEGLVGRDLESTEPLEMNADISDCLLQTGTTEVLLAGNVDCKLLNGRLSCDYDLTASKEILISDVYGDVLQRLRPESDKGNINYDMTDYPVGLYIVSFVTESGIISEKLLKY